MKDYIIVGFGLSGACMAKRLEELGRSFVIFEDGSQLSSRVAGGFMNPVILKRFTLAWNANEQQQVALSFYREMERELRIEFLEELEIYRKFYSIEEQNNWFAASDNPNLTAFLDTRLRSEINPHIPGPYSFGKVVNTYRIDTRIFLNNYLEKLKAEEKLVLSRFDYENLEVLETGITYKGLEAENIIFCDGFGLKQNPYFNYLPLTGSKGEYIFIKAPGLDLKVGVKASVFIFPVQEDIYAVGATYNNQDKSPEPTPEARHELVEKLKKMITVDFEVIDQVAGLRPSTRDRRPLVGRHPEHRNVYCCNGFGSRGILMAPAISSELLEFIEEGSPLSEEIDLSRFTRKWF